MQGLDHFRVCIVAAYLAAPRNMSKLDRVSAVLSGGEGVLPACLQDWSSLLIHMTGVFSTVDSHDKSNF